MRIKYQTLSQLKRSSKSYGLSYQETLEMAYENIRNELVKVYKETKK